MPWSTTKGATGSNELPVQPLSFEMLQVPNVAVDEACNHLTQTATCRYAVSCDCFDIYRALQVWQAHPSVARHHGLAGPGWDCLSVKP